MARKSGQAVWRRFHFAQASSKVAAQTCGLAGQSSLFAADYELAGDPGGQGWRLAAEGTGQGPRLARRLRRALLDDLQHVH